MKQTNLVLVENNGRPREGEVVEPKVIEIDDYDPKRWRLWYRRHKTETLVGSFEDGEQMIARRESHPGLINVLDNDLEISIPGERKREPYHHWIRKQNATIRAGKSAAARSLPGGADEPA